MLDRILLARLFAVIAFVSGFIGVLAPVGGAEVA